MSATAPCPGCSKRSSENYGGDGWCYECHLERVEGPATAAPAVRFLSPAELLASVPPEPPWVWQGYLARGAITLLAGKPKSGKSTLAFALAEATGNDASAFLGRDLDPGPTVYVSEEGAATLVHKVSEGSDIRLVTRESAWPRPDWPTLVACAVQEAQRVDAVLLVVDTFAHWVGLGPEAEKDAGAVQAAMGPLVEAAKANIAVLLVVHSRKGGGEDGEAIRGSSALAGAADIVLELDRVQGEARQRKLLALSRWPQTPGVLVAEHEAQDGSWCVIGEGADRADARDITDRVALLHALDYDEPTTRADLQDAMGSPARQWHGTLEHLIGTGHVAKIGAGKKGDPYRYQKLRMDSAQNPRTNGHPQIHVSAQVRSTAETESSEAANPEAARCAQSAWDDGYWQSLIDAEGAA